MTRPFFKSMAFAALLAVLTLGAWADAGAATNEEVETVITTMFPGAKVLEIADAPIDGLIELSVEDPMGNKGIIYIDEALDNIIVGKILNVSTKRNLTKERYDEFNRVDFSKIPLDDKVVLGDRKAPLKAIVFADPD